MSIQAAILGIDHSLTGTVTAGSTAAGSSASKAGDSYVQRRWRSAGTMHKQCRLDIDLGSAKSINAGWLVSSNLSVDDSSGSRAMARLRLGSSSMPSREALGPDGSPVKAGYSGDHTDVDDDPEDPDGSYMETTTDASRSARFDFPTPASAPVTGDGLQLFQVLVTAPAEGSTDVELRILDNGAQFGIMDGISVAAGTTVLYHYYWDAADLTQADGSTCQMQVVLAGGQTTDGDSRIEAVRWHCLSTAADFEGEWTAAWPDDLVGIQTDAHPRDLGDLRSTWAGYYRDGGGAIASLSARYAQWEIRDHDNADGYIEVGRAPVGPAILLESTAGEGVKNTGDVGSTTEHYRGRRKGSWLLHHMTHSNTAAVGMLGARGENSQFGFHIYPDAATSTKSIYDLPIWLTISAVNARRMNQATANRTEMTVAGTEVL